MKRRIQTVTAGLACVCALAFPPHAVAQRGGRMPGRDGGRGGQGRDGGRGGQGRDGGRGGQGRDGRRGGQRPAAPSPVRRPFVPLVFAWPDPTAPAGPEATPSSTPPTPAPPPPIPEASSIQPSPTLPPPFQSGATGSLRLDIEPRTGQLYVDGFYAGSGDAIAGSPTGLRISAGWHRLEFRAPGYETLASNVTIAPGQSSTVRAALNPLQR